MLQSCTLYCSPRVSILGLERRSADLQERRRRHMNEQVRKYLGSFRVKELQAVLEQLGLSRTGRKNELLQRIWTYGGLSFGNSSR